MRNLPQVSPVPAGESATPVHHDLVLPVAEDGGDDACPVPLGGAGRGLVLDPDLVPDLQLGQGLGTLVVAVSHLLDTLGSHQLSLLSFHQEFLFQVVEPTDCW